MVFPVPLITKYFLFYDFHIGPLVVTSLEHPSTLAAAAGALTTSLVDALIPRLTGLENVNSVQPKWGPSGHIETHIEPLLGSYREYWK